MKESKLQDKRWNKTKHKTGWMTQKCLTCKINHIQLNKWRPVSAQLKAVSGQMSLNLAISNHSLTEVM